MSKKQNSLNKSLAGIVSALLAGLFSAMGGSDKFKKSWRRYGSSIAIAGVTVYLLNDLWGLSIILLVAVYSMGHGVPSHDDEGSTIGKFAHKLTKCDPRLTDMLTRMIIAVMKCSVAMVIPIVTGNWILYIVCCLLLISHNVAFGGGAFINNEGQFKVFGTRMNWEEFIVVSLDAVFIFLMTMEV